MWLLCFSHLLALRSGSPVSDGIHILVGLTENMSNEVSGSDNYEEK